MSEERKIELSTFYGRKAGMTRIFDDNGNHVPVTVVELLPNFVSQVKTVEKDGYNAYQLAYYEKRSKLVTKPIEGHLKKADIKKLFTRFSEVRLSEATDPGLVGSELNYDLFKAATFVDVTSFSKGKGFQGVMKRYGFRGGPAAHGSHFHRGPGAIGNRATPGKVFKLKKMPGHMGNKKRTVQNQEIVALNLEKGFLLIKGTVPGAKKSIVRISKALKKS